MKKTNDLIIYRDLSGPLHVFDIVDKKGHHGTAYLHKPLPNEYWIEIHDDHLLIWWNDNELCNQKIEFGWREIKYYTSRVSLKYFVPGLDKGTQLHRCILFCMKQIKILPKPLICKIFSYLP